MKHSYLAIAIYIFCAGLIIWGIVDLFQAEKEWYVTGFIFWRIIGGLFVGLVAYFGSVRSWKKKGLK